MGQLTDRILIVAVIAFSLYDLAAMGTTGTEATISRRVLHWSQQFPLIPFAVGVLIGHLFCTQTIRVDR